jgi:hypothetical protein
MAIASFDQSRSVSIFFLVCSSHFFMSSACLSAGFSTNTLVGWFGILGFQRVITTGSQDKPNNPGLGPLAASAKRCSFKRAKALEELPRSWTFVPLVIPLKRFHFFCGNLEAQLSSTS